VKSSSRSPARKECWGEGWKPKGGNPEAGCEEGRWWKQNREAERFPEEPGSEELVIGSDEVDGP